MLKTNDPRGWPRARHSLDPAALIKGLQGKVSAGKGFCRANTLQSCARGADSRASLEKEE